MLAMESTLGKKEKNSISWCVMSGFSKKSVNIVMGFVNRCFFDQRPDNRLVRSDLTIYLTKWNFYY